MSAPDLDGYLRSRRRTVDDALLRWLPAAPACPAVLAEAMRYSIAAGGKRLRPILTLASAETVARASGRHDAESAVRIALPAACAIEMIHTYSLVHDDLPAMDNDTLRRGLPTLHVVHGEGMAILAGDGLLTEAFRLIAGEPPDPTRELAARKLRTVVLVAEAAGAHGMVGGQAVDLSVLAAGGSLDADGLRAMHAMKTGALIRAAAVSGAVMAGGSEEAIEAIGRYAADLGLGFQIVDDILDVEGTTDQIGKTAGKDAAAGKPTYPSLFGLERSRALALECRDRAVAALEAASLADGQLAAIADWVVGRDT